jgi:multidrug efflux pump subunit AcrA (membrane-fusion protein)
VASSILWLVERFIEAYASTIYRIAGEFGVDLKFLAPADQRPIAQRIAKLDEARDALSEGLRAIDDLKEEARIAKEDYDKTLSSLDAILLSKADAEQKLDSVRGLLNKDVGALRTVVGFGNVNRERFIGFGSGVAASVIASGIVWGIVAIVEAISS